MTFRGDESLIIRPAEKRDAEGIAAVLADLVEAGKRKKRCDRQFALDHYVSHPDKIECYVAEDEDGSILGFQSLKLALTDNEYGVAPGWGVIGTHITPKAARRGVGRALFDATKQAAQRSGIPAIEAFIGSANTDGQAYYEAMGFRDYRSTENAVCKSFRRF